MTWITAMLNKKNAYLDQIIIDSYLCASYADWAPWIQPRGSRCPAGLQPGPLLQSHSSGAEGYGQMWSHVALGCFKEEEKKDFKPTSSLKF